MKINMKMGDIWIDYNLRYLIQNENIRAILLDLYEQRNRTGILNIFLPIANSRFNDFALNPKKDTDQTEDVLKSCLELEDTELLNELAKMRVVTLTQSTIDEDFHVGVIIRDIGSLEQLYQWSKDKKYIINYGIFSLHTLTGVGYCLNNRYHFRPGSGLFSVFKGFISKPTHTLSYKEIARIFSGNKTRGKHEINQIIGELKEKFKMKGKLSRLFIPSDSKYLLVPTN